ncbi:MAG: hypothetical protein GY819_12815 [Planctomycetaceae bacterium]|nr:hypothetical protein [Planctomycetaceae bacterium]MCP4463671.1 hypothetical protein [Planctomycetaceae bacterium]MDG1806717.1 hypothetical protein [Pirellulaceae bacterium]MDG2103756.1 hypothetical protein [Pirellulaceae bacterium]
MHKKFSVALAAMLTALLFWGPVDAQSAKDKQAAEIAFEIRMDQLRETPMYDMLQGAAESQSGVLPSSVNGDVDKVKRIWGAVQLPEKMADIEAGQANQNLPMEMFIRIEMEDAAAATKMVTELAADSDEVTKDGKTFYTPKNGPSNLMARKVDDTTIEVATSQYLEAGTGKELFSSGLTKAWGAFGDEPIRIAIDLDNARPLVDEGLGMAKEQMDPMMHGMIDMVNKMDNVRITMDLKDGGNLLTLGMTSSDDDTAEELRSGIDGLLGMAKMMGGSQVEQLRQLDGGLADVASALLKSLKADREGDDVQIVIPKPKGFDDALQSMMSFSGAGGGDF